MIAAVVSMLAFGAVSANATVQHDWGNHFVEPAQWWTDATHRTTEVGNIVLYEGSGNAPLCELVTNLNTGAKQESCGTNGAGGTEIVKGWNGIPVVNSMKNNGSFGHTFHGYWYSP